MSKIAIPWLVLAIAAGGCDGCDSSGGASPEPSSQTAPLAQAPSTKQEPGDPHPSAEAPPDTAAQNEAVKKRLEAMVEEAKAPAPQFPKPGFSEVRVADAGPLCVFASFEEFRKIQFAKDAKGQTLQAGSKVVFGVFAPWCIHESCDQRPSLQCQADLHGETLVVQSKYWGDHKDGAKCTENCRPITAGCPTPELKEGLYTVQYGKKHFELQIPTVLPKPCF